MRISCITHPARDVYVQIRAWQVQACEGNHCAAALLSLFEYYHNIRTEQQPQAAQANEVAEAHGDQPTYDTSLLQWHTLEQLEERLLHLYGHSSIAKAIAYLLGKGWITQHVNPNPRYHFDRTKYLLFHPAHVQAYIDGLQFQNKHDASAKNSSPSAKNSSPSAKNSSPSAKNSDSLESLSLEEIGEETGEESERNVSDARAEDHDEQKLCELLPATGHSTPPTPHHASTERHLGTAYPFPADYQPSTDLLAQLALDCPDVDVSLAIKRCKATTFRQPIFDPALRLHKFCLDEQDRAQHRPGRQRTREPTAEERQREREEYDAIEARLLGTYQGTTNDRSTQP